MKKIITRFDIFINEQYHILNVNEQESEIDSKSKVALIGASLSKTSNLSAIKAIKEGFSKLKGSSNNGKFNPSILNITGEELEKNSLYVSRDKSFLKEKSERNIRDYIKLDGEIILDSTDSKPVYKKTTFSELIDGEIEASGNGIFALGRLIKAMAKKSIKDNTPVYLALNLKNTDAFIVDSTTGMQAPTARFNSSVLMAMIAGKVIKPNNENTQSVVLAGKNNIGNQEFIKTILNRNAIPFISDIDGKKKKNDLVNIGDKEKVDVSGKISDYSNKEFNYRDIDQVKKIYDSIFDEYYPEYVDLVSFRFKKYLDDTVKSLGITEDLFSDIKSSVDSWVKKSKESSYISKYKESGYEILKKAFNPVKESTGSTFRGASAGTKSIKGTEGKI